MGCLPEGFHTLYPTAMKRVWEANPRCWGEYEDTLGRMAGAGKPPYVKGVDEYASSVPGALGALVNQQGRVDYPSGAGQGSAPVPADQLPGMVPQLPGWGPLETMTSSQDRAPWKPRSEPGLFGICIPSLTPPAPSLPYSHSSTSPCPSLSSPSSILLALPLPVNSHIQTL